MQQTCRAFLKCMRKYTSSVTQEKYFALHVVYINSKTLLHPLTSICPLVCSIEIKDKVTTAPEHMALYKPYSSEK